MHKFSRDEQDDNIAIWDAYQCICAAKRDRKYNRVAIMTGKESVILENDDRQALILFLQGRAHSNYEATLEASTEK